MKPQMEYMRQSGMALAQALLDAAATGMLAPRVEGIMCQAAAYIVQNEGILEQVQESLYLIEERLGMTMEQDTTPEELEKALEFLEDEKPTQEEIAETDWRELELEGLGELAQGDPDT